MTPKKHEQYSKHFVANLLEPQGDLDIDYQIIPDMLADIYFRPASTAHFFPLGLLGKIVIRPCLIELFRLPATHIEVQTSLHKLFTQRNKLLNEAQQNNESLKEEQLPHLWIIASLISDSSLAFFGAKHKRQWCKGVYLCGDAEGLRTTIVNINRLPPTPETLLMRLLGRGKIQRQAIKDVLSLNSDLPLRHHVEELLYNWHTHLKAQDKLTKDDKYLLMSLSELVKKRQRKMSGGK